MRDHSLPAALRNDLTGQLVCYARWVIAGEWERMEERSLGDDITPWGAAMFGTTQGLELGSPVEEAAYGKWLDQTEAREVARQDRIHGAAGVMPTPLWIAMLLLLNFFHNPFNAGVGGLQPAAMGRSVRLIDQELALIESDVTIPCDATGEPVTS